MHFLCVYIEKIQINRLIKEISYKSMMFCLFVLRSGDEVRPCLVLLFWFLSSPCGVHNLFDSHNDYIVFIIKCRLVILPVQLKFSCWIFFLLHDILIPFNMILFVVYFLLYSLINLLQWNTFCLLFYSCHILLSLIMSD